MGTGRREVEKATAECTRGGANVEDSSTWCDFKTAYDYYHSHYNAGAIYGGIGRVLVREDGYTPVDAGSTGDDFASAYQPLLASLSGYTEGDRRTVTVAGQDAALLDYFLTEASGRVVRVQQVFVTQGQDGFVLSFRGAAADAAKYAMAVSAQLEGYDIDGSERGVVDVIAAASGGASPG